jgi:hypothetical protein
VSRGIGIFSFRDGVFPGFDFGGFWSSIIIFSLDLLGEFSQDIGYNSLNSSFSFAYWLASGFKTLSAGTILSSLIWFKSVVFIYFFLDLLFFELNKDLSLLFLAYSIFF